MRTFLRPGDLCEHNDERLRFERQLSDNLLLFYVEKTLAPFQIEDGNGRLKTPDCEWAIQAFSTGDLRVVANRNGLPTSARRQAEAREYDPDTAASLDQGYRRRRFVLTELDKLGEIPLSDLAIRRALDKIWAENPEAVCDLGGKPACRTVRRWLALRGHPGERHTRQLISMSGRVARARRLPLTTIRLLQRAAADYWAVRGRSIEDGYARLFRIMNYINQRRARLKPPLPQLRVPSVETLRKEIRGLECFDTYAAKYGERLAKTRFKGNGRGLTASRALRLGCMDHTLLDTVAVIDVETMLPMGRPWLTVLIDVRTRCIVGFVLTYEPPSNYAAMECIKRANRPKLHLLDRFPKFPVLAYIFGKFDEIVVDNGWELSGITFQDAMADVGTTVRWAPIASPTYKAIVERFFRILNQILNHKLPGGVLKPELLREMGYDPTKAAVLTIAELESLIWSAISYYHIEEHSTLLRPPASLWEQDMNAHGIDVIGDDRQLDKMAGALKPDCRLTTSGVELDGLREGAEGPGGYSETHYAWLCYDWENLYPACVHCQRSKRDQFPVDGRRAPLFSTVTEARRAETALLIDPCFDDPRQHLVFRTNGRVDGKSQQGETTIGLLLLNREALVEERFRLSSELFERLHHSEEALSGLHGALRPEAPHLGMTTQLLARLARHLTGASVRWPIDGVNPHKAIELFRRFDLQQVQQALRQLEAEDASEQRQSEIVGVARQYATSDRIPVAGPMEELIPHRRALRQRPSRIRVRNFKGVETLDLQIPEFAPTGGAGCLMLLGENATGKSSILEAVALALIGEHHAPRLVAAEELLRRKGDRLRLVDTEPLRVCIEFHGDAPPVLLNVEPLSRSYDGEVQPATVVVGYGPRRYAVDGKSWRRSVPWGRVEGLFKPAAAIPDPKRWLTRLAQYDEDRYYAVARGLREVLALHAEDNLVVDDDLGVCVEVHGRLTPIFRLSEGYKSLFVMAVDIMRELLDHFVDLEKAYGVVLVDEIETHLHPRWKLRIMSALRRAMPGVTFIATTHDPLCLRGMEDGEVAVLHRGVDEQVRQIPDLPSVKGMRSEQLLTSDYFGLNSTADPEIEAKLLSYTAQLAEQPSAGAAESTGHFRALEEDLSRTLVLGDTAADQIVQEALGRYLADRRDRPAPERTAAREDVVARVLQALRAPVEG